MTTTRALTKKEKQIRIGKYGLAENPVGFQVMMVHKGRTLLGDVRAVRRLIDGRCLLSVNHFNGEAWPVEPDVYFVVVLRR